VCIFSLLVVVLGCDLLGLLLVVGVSGLLLFVVGIDILGLLLLDETRISDLILVFIVAGMLGFVLATGGIIFLRETLNFGEEEVLGKTPLLHRL